MVGRNANKLDSRSTLGRFSSAKRMSVEDILQQEEEAERVLLNEQNSNQQSCENNLHSETLCNEDGDENEDDVEGEVPSLNILKRKIVVEDPAELEMLELIRAKRLTTISISSPSLSTTEDRTSSSCSPLTTTPTHHSELVTLPTLSTSEEHPRRDSKKELVQINHPSDQLRITDLEINSALLNKIENSPHFAGLQSRSTRTKFFVRFPDALPRQIVFIVNYCNIHLVVIVLFSQVLRETD